MEPLKYKGAYAECLVFTDEIEEAAVSQIYNFLNHPMFEGSKIRIMPDCHLGKGSVIGFTATMGDKVSPYTIGVDIGCFTGDTEIPLVDGFDYPIKALVDKGKILIFSCDENKRVVVAEAQAFRTRNNMELLEIILDNDAIVKCTLDHLFLLRNGLYKKAKDLRENDSLMPFNVFLDKDGYPTITQVELGDLNALSGRWSPIHRMVVEAGYLGSKPDGTVDVRHINGIKTDNRPENLEFRERSEHSSWRKKKAIEEGTTHWQSEEFKRKRVKALGDKAKTEEGREFYAKRGTENILKDISENKEKFLESVKDNGERGKKYLQEYNKYPENIKKFRAPMKYNCIFCGQKMKSQDFNNHKIKSIRKLNKKEDVYCLKVPKHHNFALTAGVFVHNCGVSSWNIGKPKLKFEKFDKYLRENIPTGTNTNERKCRSVGSTYLFRLINSHLSHAEFLKELDRVIKDTEQEADYVYRSFSSLGGGNHFFEIGQDESGEHWLTIHSGSRNFGLKIANFHQKRAKAKCGKSDLAYLEGEEAQAYLRDMCIAQIYASFNRLLMAETLVQGFYKASLENRVESVHNYIDFERNMIRKGAISAEKGEKVIIPWNMRDGLVIGEGKGLENWNWSAPHGAGRRMSRTKAKANISLDQFERSMKGIFSTCVHKRTLDEAPHAYKKHEKIKELLQENVNILLNVKPVYNHKG